MNINENSEVVNDMDSSDDEFDECIILGKSSQFQTVKWKFPDTEKCPLDGCGLSFSSRLFAIVHFRMNHSSTAMVCPICNIPFASMCTSNLEQHYAIYHPDASLPAMKMTLAIEDFSGENYFADFDGMNDMICDDIVNDDIASDDINGEGSDWIALSGCNINSKWKFPSFLNKCPQLTCSAEFNSRTDVIVHFKEKHSADLILCYLCDWPITGTDFQMHFRIVHPNEVNPFNFDNNAPKPEQPQPQPEKHAITEADDDLPVELSGCNIKTFWRFPNQTRCPVRKCLKQFENRAEAKRHYADVHAPIAILCERCDKPIASFSIMPYKIHFQKIHPNEKLPFNLDESLTAEPQEIQTNTTRRMTQVIDNSGDLIPSCTANKDNADDADDGDSDNNDDDNLIKLEGFGVVSYWQLPTSLNRCPVHMCRMVFDNNSALKKHYRLQHAKHAIYCEPCGWVVSTKGSNVDKFQDHFRKFHPNMKQPYDFGNAVQPKNNKKQHPDSKPSNIFGTNFTSTSTFASSIGKTQPIKSDEDVDDLIQLGRKSKQLSYWQFPPRMARCPSIRCGIEFGTRSAAIRHYREHHADSYILCSFCAKPVYAPTSSKIKAHFKAVHPLYTIDNDTSNGGRQTLDEQTDQSTNDKSSVQNVDQDDDNDWITLTGGSHVTYWRFPQTTQCPSRICSSTFTSRSECKSHYREVHAKYHILCPSCDTPINVRMSLNFVKHHRLMHAGVKMPYEFMIQSTAEMDEDNNSSQQNECKTNGHGEVSKVTEKKQATSDARVGTGDEWIELNSCGITSRFQFPRNRKRCLNKRCTTSFKTRAEVIKHYKRAHSMAAIYCEPCGKPVHTRYLKYWQAHCDTRHPQMESKVAADSKSIETSSTVSKSSSSKQSSKSVTKTDCPLKGCSYKTRRIHKLRKHWNAAHSDFRFPLIYENQFNDEQPNVTQAKDVNETGMISYDIQSINASEIEMDESLLVPLPLLPSSFNDNELFHQKTPCAKRQRTTSNATDVYAFKEQVDEIVDFKKRKLAERSADIAVCDGNVTSTAECSVDLSNIKMEMDSPLYDKEPTEESQFSLHSEFMLGEAHSLRPEDFNGQLESDEESFHSAEMTIEIDESSNATVADQTKEDETVASNDEMVSSTVQDNHSRGNQ